MRHVLVDIAGKRYACPEECVERVLMASDDVLYPAPFNGRLPFFLEYRDELVPVFNVGSGGATGERLIVVLKQSLNLAGIIVDRCVGFRSMEADEYELVLDVDEDFARKAMTVGGRDCYFFDTEALFGAGSFE